MNIDDARRETFRFLDKALSCLGKGKADSVALIPMTPKQAEAIQELYNATKPRKLSEAIDAGFQRALKALDGAIYE